MAWYSGQSLAQTLYCCVYLQPLVLEVLLEKAEDKSLDSSASSTLLLVFTSYLAALALNVVLLRRDVLTADIFEEEDFSIATYNIDLSLNGKLTRARVCALLNAACARLQAKKHSSGIGCFEPIHPNTEVDGKLCSVFALNLQHRLNWLISCVELAKQSTEGIDRARKHVNHTLSALRSITAEKINLGNDFFSGKCLGVDVRISRLLSTTTPPREISLLDIDRVCANFVDDSRF